LANKNKKPKQPIDYNFLIIIYNMPIMLIKSMKKMMEHVLQENVKISHVSNLK
jgi:hypothetical protein